MCIRDRGQRVGDVLLVGEGDVEVVVRRRAVVGPAVGELHVIAPQLPQVRTSCNRAQICELAARVFRVTERISIEAVSYTHLDVYKRQGKADMCFSRALLRLR